MKSLFFIFVLLLPVLLVAQNEGEWKAANAESQAYHLYRLKTTTPPYGLAKVKNLIAKKISSEEDNPGLPSKDYLALSLREKFTYHMIHPESFSQNCSLMPPVQDEHKKIFGQLLNSYDEFSWSARQLDFLNSNKDSVMAFIEESVKRSGRMGLNYKRAIVEIHALKMIPFLIETYTRDTPHKDHDILTTLILLMKKERYAPFLKSQSFNKLYGDKSSYQTFLLYNKANEELIISRAMNLFNSIH